MIRIALADDQTLVRQALRAQLEGHPGIEVVADVPSGEALLALAERELLHVAMVDIHMPGMGGLEAMRRLRLQKRSPRIVCLTAVNSASFARSLMDDGLVHAYVAKEADGREMVQAVTEVAAGRGYVCSTMTEGLDGKDTLGRFATLTEREREVLMQLFAGHSNKTIALNLLLSEKTVSQHKQNALRKLGVKSEIEAYRMARLEGWVE